MKVTGPTFCTRRVREFTSLIDARRLVKGYVEHYNNVRLNSAIGYITAKDMLVGHQQKIHADRDRKLEAAREQRKNRRHWAYDADYLRVADNTTITARWSYGGS